LVKKQDAIDHFGGVVQLAYALGCSPQAVSQWGETIPQGRAYQIEVLTVGKLKADPITPTTDNNAQ
jgi:transcriptional repressor of cell division inhibition gene dicB